MSRNPQVATIFHYPLIASAAPALDRSPLVPRLPFVHHIHYENLVFGVYSNIRKNDRMSSTRLEMLKS
jgi:hypothetical protein